MGDVTESRQIPRRIERNSVNNSEHKSGATRTASRPRLAGSAYPTIRDDAPESYASSQVITTYGVRPAEAQTFADLWTGPGHVERYLAGCEDHADTLTGLVVVTGGQTGAVGRGVVREIESVRLRGLPILVRTATQYVPLIDCRTTSYVKPWPTMGAAEGVWR